MFTTRVLVILGALVLFGAGAAVVVQSMDSCSAPPDKLVAQDVERDVELTAPLWVSLNCADCHAVNHDDDATSGHQLFNDAALDRPDGPEDVARRIVLAMPRHSGEDFFAESGLRQIDYERVITPEVLGRLSNELYDVVKARMDRLDSMPLGELGAELHRTFGCISCHMPPGAEGYGPSYAGLWGSTIQFEDAEVVVDAAYVKAAILHPSRRVRPGQHDTMPSYDGLLTERQLDALVEYVRLMSMPE